MKKLCFFSLFIMLMASASLSAISWEEDLDSDGREETIFKDSNNDGNPESAAVDKDNNGKYEEYWIDADDDGDWDRKWEDTNGDGQWDKGLLDTNDDGHFDQIWSDKDKNGKLSARETMRLTIDQQIMMNGPSPILRVEDRIDCKCAGNHLEPKASLKQASPKTQNWVLALIGMLGLVAMIMLLGRGKEDK